ncbi:hypothetical protein SDJN03_24217, partial [Cucurbita argyrosperma subsp. sororia]
MESQSLGLCLICRHMDHDRDGKLNFDEFLHHTYDIYNSYIEFQTRGDDVPSAEEKFDELDLVFYFDRYKSCNSPTPLDFDTKMSLGHSPNKVL